MSVLHFVAKDPANLFKIGRNPKVVAPAAETANPCDRSSSRRVGGGVEV